MAEKLERREGDQENSVNAHVIAEIFDLSPGVVAKMARSRQIPAYKGKKRNSPWRFFVSEVKRSLSNQNVSAATAS